MNTSICNDSINKIVQPFDERLKPLIDDLNANLSGARFIMINSTSLTTRGDDSSLGELRFSSQIQICESVNN